MTGYLHYICITKLVKKIKLQQQQQNMAIICSDVMGRYYTKGNTITRGANTAKGKKEKKYVVSEIIRDGELVGVGIYYDGSDELRAAVVINDQGQGVEIRNLHDEHYPEAQADDDLAFLWPLYEKMVGK